MFGDIGHGILMLMFALLLVRRGRTVLAVDADPDANLAASLGIPAAVRERIVPIARQIALIEERTGAQAGKFGQMFKMNPDVADIADIGLDALHLGIEQIGEFAQMRFLSFRALHGVGPAVHLDDDMGHGLTPARWNEERRGCATWRHRSCPRRCGW